MKNLFKNSAIVAGMLALSLGAKAQTTESKSTASNGVVYSIGADAGISTGSFRGISNWNLGGSIQADIPVANSLSVNINAGYLNFFGKSNISGTSDSRPDVNYLPVKAGLKYFLVSGLYIQGDAGAAFVLNKNQVGYGKTTAFIYSPQVGYLIPLGGKNYIDAGVLYEASTKFVDNVDDSRINFLGLRVAYAFSW